MSRVARCMLVSVPWTVLGCGPQRSGPCERADRELELSIARCKDPACTDLEPHPWGPQPPALGGVWKMSCAVASTDADGDGASTVRLDACTQPEDSEAPLGILISLADDGGAVLDLATGTELDVEYHSTRDDLTWLWRGWVIRDTTGRVIAARTTGGPPTAEALDFDAISVSDFGCDTAPSYCGGTERPGWLYLEAGSTSVSVRDGSAETLRRGGGEWVIATPRVVIYEDVTCGAYSSYESVELAVIAARR